MQAVGRVLRANGYHHPGPVACRACYRDDARHLSFFSQPDERIPATTCQWNRSRLRLRLAALGFVLIYKATDIVNFAHGEVMMVGAFLGLTFIEILKMPYWIGLLLAIACMTVFGMLLNRFLLRPLAGQGILAVIVVTLGLSILLRAFASVIWGPETFTLQTPFYNRVVRVGEVVLSQEHVAIIVLTIVLVAALYVFFRYSRIGIAMQATSENQLAAYYVGIPVQKVHSLIWRLARPRLVWLASCWRRLPLYRSTWAMSG